MNKIESLIVAKAKESNIKNFSDNEICRVFDETAAPTRCKEIFITLIKNGLTIDKIFSD